MSKIGVVFLDINLAFVEKVVLVDGTVLENARVLYKSPVPNADQVEVILNEGAELSKQLLGQASHKWSRRPETMVNSRLFKE